MLITTFVNDKTNLHSGKKKPKEYEIIDMHRKTDAGAHEE